MPATTIEKVGQRVYLAGLPFGAKDRAKALGAHWDADRRQWWLGTAKADAAAALVAEVNGGADQVSATPEDPDQIRLVGKARYKGRVYYVRALSADGTRARLTTLDASVQFWGAVGSQSDQAQIFKYYEAREVRQGYSRHTRIEYTTLGSIRKFIERSRADEKLAREKSPAELGALGWRICWECGRLCPPDRLDSSGYCGC